MVLILIGVAAQLGMGRLRPVAPWAVVGRSVLQAGAMVIYFGCLALLPIGVVVAGLFTAPIFVLLIEVGFQRKRVGIWRIAAIAMGFLGAMLVIRPDPAALDPVAFLPILAGLLYAMGAVATRAWCASETTMTLTAGFFVFLTLFGLAGVLLIPGGEAGAAGFPLRGWMPLTGEVILWTAIQAAGAVVGILCIFRGYLLGEASRVAVFEYSMLVFASFWAWVMWGQTVPGLALIGMALIFVAGCIIAWRSDPVEVVAPA
jgi:drug/metabolite transporter (DMT)-like permease